MCALHRSRSGFLQFGRSSTTHPGLMRTLIASCVGLVLILAVSDASAAAEKHVVLFDPDANHDAIVSITGTFNEYLRRSGGNLKFQPILRQKDFDEALRHPDTELAIVASDYLSRTKEGELVPLLVPSSNGDPYYRKLLVDRGKGTAGVLDGQMIAATGEDQSGKTMLALLREGGLGVKNAAILPVQNDINALLALSFGEVAAALVTPSSVQLLRDVNPGLVQGLRTVYQTPRILRAPLCVAHNRIPVAKRKEVVELFRKMMGDPGGERVMHTLGFDQWQPFEPGMVKK